MYKALANQVEKKAEILTREHFHENAKKPGTQKIDVAN
jgi:hypothetical protein